MKAAKYSPPILKQRPAGDWVVDQYDHAKQKVRRLGGPCSEQEAREIYDTLTNPPTIVTDRPWYD